MMPYLPCRGARAQAVVAALLLLPWPAVAQIDRPHEHGGLIQNLATGASFEIVDQAKAERHLQRLGVKLRRDAARNDAAALHRDARAIDRARFRIGVDEWLIRYNQCQQLGSYPNPICLDPQSCAAIGQYRRPPIRP